MKSKIEDLRFVFPAVLSITVLLVFPLVYCFWITFYGGVSPGGIPVNFKGLANYIAVLKSADFWRALYRTVVFTVSSVALKVILGLISALLLNREFKGRGLIRGLIIIPWTMPIFVIGLVWYAILSWNGPINHILKLLFNMEAVIWLGSKWAFISLIFVNVWRGFPFSFLGLLSGLQGIPADLYEAGKIDGANAWQLCKYITLPCLKPVMMTVSLLTTIWTFSEFNLIYLLTKGGPGQVTETLPIIVFSKAFNEVQPNVASTISILALPIYITLISRISRRMAD